MYCKFYGLKERPFNVTSDPDFFYLSAKHKEALAHLHYGVSQRKGIIVLTGEIGTGKTTICRFFINQLEKNVKTALILNPHFSEIQLLDAIVRDFGIKTSSKVRLGLIRELNAFLLNESNLGNNIVLIIDEAQNLKPAVLEQVRLLSNLETEKEKLLQVILVGQPELNTRLNLYELRQLRQRIMVRYHILPLERKEIREYIEHRLNFAGLNSGIEFSDEAISAITDFSCGTPRLINMICDRALLAGFTCETRSIDKTIINKCLDELNGYAVGGRCEYNL
ncbi:MAG: AAA family ATPase [Candidatus Omnitrophica bacterium]|nr:AAA family ATPase [Candidatus Omnitrophota bacterium]